MPPTTQKSRNRSVEIETEDGYRLRVRIWQSPTACHGAVVVAPAIGVRSILYHPLARFLSRRGFDVHTFDYRGMDGGVEHARKIGDGAFTWGEQDLSAVLANAAESAGELPLIGLGHSFGGGAFGFSPQIEKLDQLILIASQSGYFGDYPLPTKGSILIYSAFLIPVFTRIMGYFPANWFGQSAPLPRKVSREWASWCRRPDYLLGALNQELDGGHYAAYSGPLTSISFTDDPMATKKAVDKMAGYYRNAQVTRQHLAPSDFNLNEIGHFGFFRRQGDGRHWEYLLRHIEEATTEVTG